MTGHHPLHAVAALAARLSRRRGFLALTVAVLGLGLGATLTVLEVADAFFWRPFLYPGEDRLVFAWQSDGRGTRLTVTGVARLTKAMVTPDGKTFAFHFRRRTDVLYLLDPADS